MEKEDSLILKVSMFGKFEISYKGIKLSSSQIRSEMTELLFIYILCHHEKEITMQEICENLWGEDESNNPIGALKNLMYRLRSILKGVWDDTFIMTGRGSYRWNPDILIDLDCERFDEIIKQVREDGGKEAKKALLEEAVQLYSDNFLTQHTEQRWILLQATYYQSQYLNIVKKLVQLYIYEENFIQLELLCNTALKFDVFDETIHYHLMFAYMKQGKRSIAIEHYRTTTKMMYDELGIEVSKDLQDLYGQMQQQENSAEMDLGIIQHDLNESLFPKGAFLCEYGIFKEIYRLQARQAQRMGISIYCALLSVHVTLDIPSESEFYKKLINQAIYNIQNMILTTLRVGDCASRYSITQFVVLLPTCTYESAMLVMGRIQNKYLEIDPSRRIELTYDVRELMIKEEREEVYG